MRILVFLFLSCILFLNAGCIEDDLKRPGEGTFKSFQEEIPYPEETEAPDRLDVVPEEMPPAVDDPEYTGEEEEPTSGEDDVPFQEESYEEEADEEPGSDDEEDID